MEYNLTKEDKDIIKAQFSAWQEIQDEKKALSEAEKGSKEKVKEILDCKIGTVGKLFKLMQKRYNGDDEDEDIWAVLESLSSTSSGDDEEETEEEED